MAIPTAGAAVNYVPLCGGLGIPALCQGNFSFAFMIAVDNSGEPTAGDVYMTTLGFGGNAGVWRFNADGESVPFSGTNANISGNELTFPGETVGPVGVAVDSAGNFYVTERETNTVDKFTPAGELAGTFPLPEGTIGTGVAVDNTGGPSNGDIYVSHETGGIIDKLDPSGGFIKSSTVEPANPLIPYQLAVDTHGHVYVSNHEAGGAVQIFSEELAFERTIGEGGSLAVAVDPSTDDIFIAYGDGHIQAYDSTGAPVGSSFGSLNTPFGIAVDGVSGAAQHFVYGAEFGNNQGSIFGFGPPPATPVTGSATVEGTSVKFHGELNPGGEEGKLRYHFAYNAGGTCTGGGVTPTATIAEAKEAAVEAEAEGLTPNTTYKFCLVAINPFSEAPGNELEFTTEASKPVVEAQSAEAETKTSAKVLATINPSGAPTTCKVEYGLTNTYGSEKPCPATAGLEGTGITGVPVSVTLTGLEPGSEYHYRFVANNAKGTGQREEDATFATKPLIEGKILAASEVTAEGATLNGEITSGAEGASYQFEYGTASVSEHKTPLVTFEHETTGGGFDPISAAISGLAFGTTYHVRLVVFAVGSPTALEGGEVEFTTHLATAKIEEEFSEREERHTASLGGEVTPKSSETTYFFEYATAQEFEETGTYNHFTASGTIPAIEAGESPIPVGPVPLSELEPGTEYHYRMVAINGGGTTHGPDATFETAEPLLPFVIAVLHQVTSPTSAILGAKVESDGLPTSYTLEVGSTLDQNGRPIYSTPTFGGVPDEGPESLVSVSLTNLLPGTVYYFRFIVHNEDGTFTGADHTFATGGFPSGITPPPPVQLIPTPKLEEVRETVKRETRAQKYKKALTLCQKKPKKKRAACRRLAKKHFGPVKKKGKK